jgi:hypothetical protein
MRHRTCTLLALLALCIASCGEDENNENPTGSATAGQAEPTETRRKKREKKDRGEAAMTIGGVKWQAERAKVDRKDDKLIIRSSHTDIDGKKVSRQELQLVVDGFSGPGDYTTRLGGSRFIGVGLDAGKVEGAGDGDEAAREVATEALAGAEHLMLSNAKVTIDQATDDQVTGTFSWEPPAGTGQPAITGGSFRALYDKD